MPAKIVPREQPGDESALRARSERIVSTLLDLGITHAVGLPDNTTRAIFELIERHPRIELAPVCREGEAWAVASGLWVGGQQPVVIIQNTGFLESGDALRGTATEMAVPLLAVMDYRGFHSLKRQSASAAPPDSAAEYFEPTLKAWGLPYHFLEDGRELDIMRGALALAREQSRPVAVLMK